MNRLCGWTRIGLAGLVSAGVGACAPMAVKDIVSDKTGYLKQNFAVEQLPDDVKKQLGVGSQPSAVLGTVRIKVKLAVKREDKHETASVAHTYFYAGSGVVQEMAEFSNNDIPYAMRYALSYRSLIPLKNQSVRYTSLRAGLIFEAKQISRTTPGIARPSENTEYVFEWGYGSTVQLSNFVNIKLTCRSGKFYSAASLHPKLSGEALELNCTREVNGSVAAKHRYALLQSYGFAIEQEYQSSTRTQTDTIEDVEIL